MAVHWRDYAQVRRIARDKRKSQDWVTRQYGFCTNKRCACNRLRRLEKEKGWQKRKQQLLQ
jgi:hypothetical protein